MSNTNTCDYCYIEEDTEQLIWITTEDFTPHPEDDISKLDGYDALCSDCYGFLTRVE